MNTRAKPVVPIPPDAKPGDVIVCRGGFSVEIVCGSVESSWKTTPRPGYYFQDNWESDGRGADYDPERDCIAFIRQSPKPTPPARPARPDKDAQWIMDYIDGNYRAAPVIRLRKIARRLNGGKLPVTRKGKS